MKKYIITIISLPALFWASGVKAVCPVCTVAVCAGVGLSRWLGVDDLISGVWVGGLTISVSIWIYEWLKNKKYNFKYSFWVTTIVMYALVVIPLYLTGIMGSNLNKFLGFDKLLFGIASGTLAFLIGVWLHGFLKSRNNAKSYFSYQKVILPILALLTASLIFYYLPCK